MKNQNYQYKEVLLESIRRRQEEKYRYYEPIGKVEEFLSKFGSCDYFVSTLSAANGIGKTTLIGNILANMFYEPKNKYFDQKLFKNYPYALKRGRIVSDPTTIKSTIIPMLEEWLKPGTYSRYKMGKNYWYHWEIEGGWAFDIMSYDQAIKEFESVTLGWCLFDEPPPEPIYKACIARMRRGGIVGIFMTPLTGSAWIYDDIITNQNNEEGQRFWLTANMEDACIEHGERGFLRHADIERIVQQFNEEDKQARYFGRFQHLSGLVFKEFDPKIHIIEPFEIDPYNFVVVEALDTHPRVPDAVLYVAINDKGQHFVIDEIFENGTTGQLAYKIKQKRSNYRVVKKIIEPGAFNKDQHRDLRQGQYPSLADELLYEHGLDFEAGSKRRYDAIKKISDYFSYQKVENEFIKSPNLYVFNSCKTLIYELQHYQWDEWRGKSAENKSKKGVPMDKDDHEIENLGRILLESVEFKEFEQLSNNNNQSNYSVDPYD